MKINKTTMILTTLVCIIPIIAGLALYSKLPDTMITHWGIDGEANGWMSRPVAVFVLPGALLILNLLLPLLLRVDPKRENFDGKMTNIVLWIVPVTSLFASGITLMAGMGVQANVGIIAPMFVGVIFAAIGNYLPKTRQNYTVGIRISWTLASEENWNKTHRMGGFIWFVCGILIVITGFIGLIANSVFVIAALGILIAIPIVAPCVYSYMLYRKGI